METLAGTGYFAPTLSLPLAPQGLNVFSTLKIIFMNKAIQVSFLGLQILSILT
jgi:hypothetical protein